MWEPGSVFNKLMPEFKQSETPCNFNTLITLKNAYAVLFIQNATAGDENRFGTTMPKQ